MALRRGGRSAGGAARIADRTRHQEQAAQNSQDSQTLLRAGSSMAGCGWIKPLARAALLILWIAGSIALAQSSVGSLSGKLTDLYSKPLEEATIVLRNRETGVEVRTTTARGGSYRFRDLAPGEYSLEARSRQLGQGQVNGIEVTAGHEARVQAAIEFGPGADVEGAARKTAFTDRVSGEVLGVETHAGPAVSTFSQPEKPETTFPAIPFTLAADRCPPSRRRLQCQILRFRRSASPCLNQLGSHAEVCLSPKLRRQLPAPPCG